MDRLNTLSYGSNEHYEPAHTSSADVNTSTAKHIARSRSFSSPVATSSNDLLRSLPAGLFKQLQPSLRSVYLSEEQFLYMQDDKLDYIYFPETAVISLVTLLDAGLIEAITIGNDGFVGLPVFHGPGATVTRANCQMPGTTWRLSTADFRKLLPEMPELARALDRYSQLVIETISQSAACNRVHVIEERCARWLLMSHDRVACDEIPLTQEFLAQMLGVRRPGVTVAIGILERAGLINHGRGRITVTNRKGLEAASCECYGAIKRRESILSRGLNKHSRP